jgi:hypothetical protein
MKQRNLNKKHSERKYTMRKNLRRISLIFILCFLIPFTSFGEYSNQSVDVMNVNGFLIETPKGYDFNMSFISDMKILEPIQLRILFGDKLKNSKSKYKVEIILSEGATLVGGDAKFDLDPSVDYKDISILAKEYGQYDISLKLNDGLLEKGYSMIIQERWASYGAKLDRIHSSDELEQMMEFSEITLPEKTSTISITDMSISAFPTKASISDPTIGSAISPDQIILDVGEVTIINEFPKEAPFPIIELLNNRKLLLKNIGDLIILPYSLTTRSFLIYMEMPIAQ